MVLRVGRPSIGTATGVGVASGRRRALNVKLTARGRRLAARARRLTTVFTGTDAAGVTTTSRQTVKLAR